MKKIDHLLIRAFLGPFLVTFFITMFVMVMQFLWLFIDEIVGKGVGISLVSELLFYSSIPMIPRALPIAICISSVMVIGDMSEHYELSSIKSAGISFLRVLAPLFIVTLGIAAFSFFCSNNLIPAANFKLKTRLKDIRSSKGILNLEEGVFNDDFKGFVIHIGKKEKNGSDISDVIVYQNIINQSDEMSVITAKNGAITHSDDGQYLLMQLNDGIQYREPKSKSKDKPINTFTRTYFKEWNKVFSLNEFEITPSDGSRNKSNYTMMSYTQLTKAIDSLDQKMANNHERLSTFLSSQLKSIPDLLEKQKAGLLINSPPTTSSTSFLKTISPKKWTLYLNQVKLKARNIRDRSIATTKKLAITEEIRVKHIFEQQKKLTMAVVCLIFLFIGGSMGAIIRKGGFGYPILIAISFFIFFIILQMFFKKLGESFVVQAEYAPWFPCFILIPIAVFLTYRAK